MLEEKTKKKQKITKEEKKMLKLNPESLVGVHTHTHTQVVY